MMRLRISYFVLFLVSISAPFSAAQNQAFKEDEVLQYAKSIDVSKLDSSLASQPLEEWLRGAARIDELFWSISLGCDNKDTQPSASEELPLCVKIGFRRGRTSGFGVLKVGTKKTGIEGQPAFQYLDVLAPEPVGDYDKLSEFPRYLEEQSDYLVSQKLRLTAAANGIDGILEVLIDSRLTPEMQRKMWGIGDWSFVFSERDPEYAAFAAKAPKNARLRIVGKDNREVRTLSLEQPLARVTLVKLLGTRSTFFVAVDYSVGFGSYAGVSTQLLDVIGGHFNWIESVNADTNEVQPIRLQTALKSAWKLIPSRGNKDILLVYCRPGANGVKGQEFLTRYLRVHFNGKQWVENVRLRNVMWESDEPFPALSSFP